MERVAVDLVVTLFVKCDAVLMVTLYAVKSGGALLMVSVYALNCDAHVLMVL
jgi:hypothetical protein